MGRSAVGILMCVVALWALAYMFSLAGAALTLMNRSSHALIGQPARNVFADRPDIIERYRQVSEAHEELVLDAGSDARSFDLRISPIYDRNGRLNGRVIVLRDITERRRAAAELRP